MALVMAFLAISFAQFFILPISSIKLIFWSVKGYCVYMINKIIRSYLKIRSSLLVFNSKSNFISTRAHVLFSIYGIKLETIQDA